MSAGTNKIGVTVTEVSKINHLVTRFKFERTDGGLLPTFSGGAHTVVEMNDNGTKRMNPYSLMSDPQDQTAYTIAVRRNPEGRGGSMFLHNDVWPGTEMVISYPVNLFSLDLRAKKHLMIAGGIGITPFLAQMKQASVANHNFELHYSSASRATASFADELSIRYPNCTNFYYDDRGQRINFEHLFSGQLLGTHIYVCGPKPMIDAVIDTAIKMGWPEKAIHYEEFLRPPSGEPFSVNLAKSGKTIDVGEDQSMLDAIEAAGVDAPYLCRGGVCGQCECNVVEYDGELQHHDHWLDENERKSGQKIMPCVSRFQGKSLTLNL